ncbi:DUF3016 domain-containing protein [Methylobacterium sp. J-077]|uniref:DUF3016 domain-containing protein n=1 Tax=Methylobacterium sp. J-077 TaxID=2836656 RepID=UPI001FB9AACB|nr:DUF3016 domain-containing protein [Methylobacterium sp. J-077]MCJ2121434.1 DUF3016 domain-containing protein [Methylobacterium sp. J-077]
MNQRGAGRIGLVPAGLAAAEVQTCKAAPGRFTDAENRFASGQPLRVKLAEPTRFLVDLGKARLRPDERLDITVLDIARAGFDGSGFASPTGIRIVTDVIATRASPPAVWSTSAASARLVRKAVSRGG